MAATIIVTRFAGMCPACGAGIAVDERVYFVPGATVQHERCGPPARFTWSAVRLASIQADLDAGRLVSDADRAYLGEYRATTRRFHGGVDPRDIVC